MKSTNIPSEEEVKKVLDKEVLQMADKIISESGKIKKIINHTISVCSTTVFLLAKLHELKHYKKKPPLIYKICLFIQQQLSALNALVPINQKQLERLLTKISSLRKEFDSSLEAKIKEAERSAAEDLAGLAELKDKISYINGVISRDDIVEVVRADAAKLKENITSTTSDANILTFATTDLSAAGASAASYLARAFAASGTSTAAGASAASPAAGASAASPAAGASGTSTAAGASAASPAAGASAPSLTTDTSEADLYGLKEDFSHPSKVEFNAYVRSKYLLSPKQQQTATNLCNSTEILKEDKEIFEQLAKSNQITAIKFIYINKSLSRQKITELLTNFPETEKLYNFIYKLEYAKNSEEIIKLINAEFSNKISNGESLLLLNLFWTLNIVIFNDRLNSLLGSVEDAFKAIIGEDVLSKAYQEFKVNIIAEYIKEKEIKHAESKIKNLKDRFEKNLEDLSLVIKEINNFKRPLETNFFKMLNSHIKRHFIDKTKHLAFVIAYIEKLNIKFELHSKNFEISNQLIREANAIQKFTEELVKKYGENANSVSTIIPGIIQKFSKHLELYKIDSKLIKLYQDSIKFTLTANMDEAINSSPEIKSVLESHTYGATVAPAPAPAPVPAAPAPVPAAAAPALINPIFDFHNSPMLYIQDILRNSLDPKWQEEVAKHVKGSQKIPFKHVKDILDKLYHLIYEFSSYEKIDPFINRYEKRKVIDFAAVEKLLKEKISPLNEHYNFWDLLYVKGMLSNLNYCHHKKNFENSKILLELFFKYGCHHIDAFIAIQHGSIYILQNLSDENLSRYLAAKEGSHIFIHSNTLEAAKYIFERKRVFFESDQIKQQIIEALVQGKICDCKIASWLMKLKDSRGEIFLNLTKETTGMSQIISKVLIKLDLSKDKAHDINDVIEFIHLAIERGANINAKNTEYFDYTPLMYLTSYNTLFASRMALFKELLELGASPNQFTSKGSIPLSDLIVFKNVEAVKLVLKYSDLGNHYGGHLVAQRSTKDALTHAQAIEQKKVNVDKRNLDAITILELVKEELRNRGGNTEVPEARLMEIKQKEQMAHVRIAAFKTQREEAAKNDLKKDTVYTARGKGRKRALPYEDVSAEGGSGCLESGDAGEIRSAGCAVDGSAPEAKSARGSGSLARREATKTISALYSAARSAPEPESAGGSGTLPRGADAKIRSALYSAARSAPEPESAGGSGTLPRGADVKIRSAGVAVDGSSPESDLTDDFNSTSAKLRNKSRGNIGLITNSTEDLKKILFSLTKNQELSNKMVVSADKKIVTKFHEYKHLLEIRADGNCLYNSILVLVASGHRDLLTSAFPGVPLQNIDYMYLKRKISETLSLAAENGRLESLYSSSIKESILEDVTDILDENNDKLKTYREFKDLFLEIKNKYKSSCNLQEARTSIDTIDLNQLIRAYKRNILSEGSFGGALEISILANILGINIKVRTTNADGGFSYTLFKSINETSSFIKIHHTGDHYDAILSNNLVLKLKTCIKNISNLTDYDSGSETEEYIESDLELEDHPPVIAAAGTVDHPEDSRSASLNLGKRKSPGGDISLSR